MSTWSGGSTQMLEQPWKNYRCSRGAIEDFEIFEFYCHYTPGNIQEE
jgi:hypothetical protein